MDIICDELNKTKSKLHDQWVVEEALIKQKEYTKEQKKAEMEREVKTFIKCFNDTYPNMKAYKPWFGYNGYNSLKVSIMGRVKVAEVSFRYDDRSYGLCTEISEYQTFGSIESLVASQRFINCLKPNAFPFTIPFD